MHVFQWSECIWECVNVSESVNVLLSCLSHFLHPHPGIVIFSTDASISPTTSFSVRISFSHLREISKIVQATGDQSLPSKFDQLGSRKIPNGIWICSVPLNVDFFELVLNCFCKLYLSDNKKIRLLAPLHVWAIW